MLVPLPHGCIQLKYAFYKNYIWAVNSEIFESFFFAKYREIKPSRTGEITLSLTMPYISRDCFKSHICFLTLLARIELSKLAGVNYHEWRGNGKTPFKLIFGKFIIDSANSMTNLSSQIKITICPMQFPALNGKSMDFNAAQFSCESLNCLNFLREKFGFIWWC